MFNLVRELYMKGIWNNYNLGLGFYAQIEGVFFFLLWTLIHEIECFRMEKRRKKEKKKEDLIKV